MGLALVWCVAPKACGGLLCAAQFEQRADASFIGLENPRSEHGLCGALLDEAGSGADKFIQRRALMCNDQARVSTKLPGTLSQGGHEALGQ